MTVSYKQLKKLSKPQPLDLKGDDFQRLIPEDMKFELIVHFKGKGYYPEVINPVHAFAKQDGKLKVINRNLLDTCYTFDLSEVQKVFLFPMEI